MAGEKKQAPRNKLRLIALEEDYAKDRSYSAQFEKAAMAVIQAIPLPPTIRLASEREDTKQATDLVVSQKTLNVAFRVRRPEFQKWRDVTLRSSRKSGTKTEVAKIIEDGFADRYFYAYAAYGEKPALESWVYLDLVAVRRALALEPTLLGNEVLNHDGETAFRPLAIRALPDDCIVAHDPAFLRPPVVVNMPPTFEKGGLVAKTYATIKARYGYWGTAFLKMLKGHDIPAHIQDLAEVLSKTRPWERPRTK